MIVFFAVDGHAGACHAVSRLRMSGLLRRCLLHCRLMHCLYRHTPCRLIQPPLERTPNSLALCRSLLPQHRPLHPLRSPAQRL